jgi:cellulose 1,4-beta-cellobiosidase
MKTSAAVIAALLGLTSAQQIGHQKQNTNLKMSLKTCSKDMDGCQSEQKDITLDANWRWLHGTGGYQNCYTGNSWDSQFCPDNQSCAKNCALDGVPQSDWTAPYGIKSDGTTL